MLIDPIFPLSHTHIRYVSSRGSNNVSLYKNQRFGLLKKHCYMIFRLDAETLHGVLNVIINRFYYGCIQKRCLFIQDIGVVFDQKRVRHNFYFSGHSWKMNRTIICPLFFFSNVLFAFLILIE